MFACVGDMAKRVSIWGAGYLKVAFSGDVAQILVDKSKAQAVEALYMRAPGD